MDNKPSLAGLYRMDVAGHTYYGETVNLPRRRNDHWDDLVTKRHHCILLRRLVCAFGIESVSFTVISQGPQWEDVKVRKAAELALIVADENALNTAGRLGVYATNLRLPNKAKYRDRTLYVQVTRGVAMVYEERGGKFVGIERVKGKLATGYYISDDRSFINAAPNKRRESDRRPRKRGDGTERVAA